MEALQLTRSSPSGDPTLLLVSLPIPTVKHGHALVKIHYSYIHPSDRLNAKGGFPSTVFPCIPGRDFSGVVVDIASDDEAKSWIGKEVYGSSGSALGFTVDGPHARYCLIPEEALVEKPSSLSLLQASTVGVPFATALLCLRRAQTRKDDIVLVLGATGAVGSAAVQIAKAMGCRTVLTAARRADSNPDILLEDVDNLQSRIPGLTKKHGVDVVIDAVGSIELMSAAIKQLAVNGRYAWIAAPRGTASKELTFDIFQAYRKAIHLEGCNTGLTTMAEVMDDLRLLRQWFDEGLLKVEDDGAFHRVPLAAAVEKGYLTAGERVVIEM
ncbi:alcohol dehydrogenase [Aspergillus sclerotioniger CBS 115572]|uniref:Alcohol dehydrogenase n=1 Tax=Aspergillus sclerotioniger CBS 115572 TaxID=1450535 RepID=A0A317XH11_9EURO|nr:alcohol dehydrogenase [Aspergillus sclerotioniger CBS 115572]PWY96708.1 alcohol dehydrogenase [Aspergillus sclerotioniger CBS 115572]